ncbi:MAG: DUF6502 family protein [Pseudomonadota bacterium]
MPAIRRLLVPLVRLMLRFGITLPATVELLKSVYVEVADREFRLPDRPPSNSRISLLSGVHRKDVRRLLATEPEQQNIPATVSIGAQLVGRWLSDHVDADGRPQTLTIRGGSTPSFEQLVTAVGSKDLRPRVVLDELVRLGVVTLDGDHVTLNQDAFIPAQGLEEKAYYFGANLHDHLAAGAHNLSSTEPAFLDRAVRYHDLSEDDVSKLRAQASELSTEVLRTLNRRALAMKKSKRASDDATHRMAFGVFFFAEEGTESAIDENAPASDED